MENVMLLHAHLTDKELINKVKNGLTSCFEVLVRKHNQALYRIGRMYGLAHEDVERLMHDTHIVAYKKLKRFSGATTYRMWVSRIMIKKCAQWLKTEYRLRKVKDATDPAGLPSEELSICGNIRIKKDITHTAFNNLENDIAQLPEPVRSVFVLTEVEGYNETEAAILLDLPETKVKTFMQKAKASLSKMFRKWYYHTEVYAFHLSMGDNMVHKIMCTVTGSDEVHGTLAP